MINTQVTSAVFDNAQVALTGARAATDVVTNTINAFSSPQQPAFQGGTEFSRRDSTVQQPVYQQPAYQPPAYPWETTSPTFGASMNPIGGSSYGYPGISNPQYGKIGLARSVASQPDAQSQIGSNFHYNGCGGWAF